jgi:hypothetical protein
VVRAAKVDVGLDEAVEAGEVGLAQAVAAVLTELQKRWPMKLIGSYTTAQGVEVVLFYIEDRHLGQAVGPQTAPPDSAGVLAEVRAASEDEAREKLIEALKEREG